MYPESVISRMTRRNSTLAFVLVALHIIKYSVVAVAAVVLYHAAQAVPWGELPMIIGNGTISMIREWPKGVLSGALAVMTGGVVAGGIRYKT